MKRRTTHTLFAALSLSTALLAGQQWWSLHRTEQANALIMQLAHTGGSATTVGSAERDAAPVQSTPARSIPTGSMGDQPSRVQLALANAQARADDLSQAERLYTEIIRAEGESVIGLSARYNLANRYLREAMNTADQRSARPLLELAKQRYRDLLRRHPDDWQARYNLERTLRLAPELPDVFDPDDKDPVKSVNVVVPGFDPKNLP